MQLSSIPMSCFFRKNNLQARGGPSLGGDLPLRPDKTSLAETAQLFVAVEFSP
jgi:hypothetical protein